MKHDDCKYMSTNGRETEEWKCKMLGFCQHLNIWGIVAHEFCDLGCMYYEEKDHDKQRSNNDTGKYSTVMW